MKVEASTREFSYNGVALKDPNPAHTVEQVRDFYTAIYPEIASAAIEGPELSGNKMVYSFRRAVGTKGMAEPTARQAGDDVLGMLVDGAAQLVPGADLAEEFMDETLVDFIQCVLSERLAAHRRSGGQHGWWHASTLTLNDLRNSAQRAAQFGERLDALAFSAMVLAREAMEAKAPPTPDYPVTVTLTPAEQADALKAVTVDLANTSNEADDEA